ncbi:MAG: Uncharacterised protein [Cellulomonadaceae bacterium TMED98]|nr:MAG: Uncharacterised protein [Cellulomonadaceae bacterium TMED98]
MTTNNDGLIPARNKTGNIGNDDRLAENHAADDVSNGAVGAAPHLLQAKFFDPGLIGGDGGAFDADTVFFDGVGRVDGDLVVGLVALFDT